MFLNVFSWSNLWLLLKVLPLLLCLFILYKFLYRYQQERIFTRLEKAAGCSPPVQWRIWDPVISLDFLWFTYKGFVNRTVMEDTHRRFIKMKANTLKTYIMGHFISTMEPQNVKAVLATHFKDFELGEERRMTLGTIIGEGIFILDGPEWKHSRDMLRPNFERAQIDDTDLFENHAQDLVNAIPKNGEPVALKPLLFSASLDVATEFLFDHSTNCLDPSKRKAGDDLDVDGFIKTFNQLQQIFDGSADSNFGFFGLIVKIFLPDYNRKKNVKILHQFVDTIVAQAKAKQEKEKPAQPKNGDEKHRYVFLHELLASTSNPTKIRSELLNILLAGRDSTASLLSNIFFTLSHNPSIFAKLEHEILTSLPSESNPSFAQLKSLPYLHALINESLRLYPIVPENNRTAIRDTSIPLGGGPDGKSPVFVRKGTMVHWSSWGMHRRPDLYGDDAEEFRPERWLDSDGPDGKKGLRVSWEYLPFNGGPRICIGQQFALMEVSYLIVKLVRAFEGVEPCNKDSTWRENVSIIVAVDSDVNVVLKPRKKV